jgi:hypothetical protein
VRICNAPLECDGGTNRADEYLLGTFARVWLTRLSNPQKGDEDKVFALKILRKVDGMQAIISK